MNKKAILFLVLLVTTSGISSNAKADGAIIIEPGIGYKEESLKLTDLSQNLTKVSMKGPVGSLKIGMVSAAGISLLLTGEQMKGKATIDGNLTDKPKFTHTIAGFQVGVSAMNAMKIYLGYSPHNKLAFETEGTVQGFTLSGQTYTAGVMFFPFRYIGLGVQYNINQFKEVEGSQYTLGKETDLYFDKIDSTDLSVTLSIML
ncbi:hypothetical protein CIK05_07405 [Bdellovibrio sp. qaytius]|nr:hypothetical protein CIK05_07405 [Bdellovibrio sp. qaytius]